jgi:hypothetical protein
MDELRRLSDAHYDASLLYEKAFAEKMSAERAYALSPTEENLESVKERFRFMMELGDAMEKAFHAYYAADFRIRIEQRKQGSDRSKAFVDWLFD